MPSIAAVETLHHNLDPNIPLILGSDPKDGKGRGIVSRPVIMQQENLEFALLCQLGRHGEDVQVRLMEQAIISSPLEDYIPEQVAR